MRSPNKNSFYSQSPRRILSKAKELANNIEQTTELRDKYRIEQLKDLGERRKNDVKEAIDYNKSQNDLFRKLEKDDEERRRSLHMSIEAKVNKIRAKRSQHLERRESQSHKQNENIVKKFNKHLESQSQYGQKRAEKAKQMTGSMVDFHKKQLQQMKAEWTRLKNLKTCHRRAENLINMREQKKRRFAVQTEKQLEIDLQKNCKKENPQFLNTSRRRNKKLDLCWKTSCDFYSSRHNKFLQTYCSDLDTAEQMVQLKKQEFKKTSERISKFLKDRQSRWAKLKAHVDQTQSAHPEKCLNKINKSLNSSTMRNTSSAFHETSQSWRRSNSKKKQRLRMIQTQRDNRILEKHLNTTLRNRNEDSLNTSMTDLMMKAGFHAKEFL